MAVITDRFVQTARLLAEFNGLKDYPFAVIPHPIADNRDAELRDKALDTARQCAKLLAERTGAESLKDRGE